MPHPFKFWKQELEKLLNTRIRSKQIYGICKWISLNGANYELWVLDAATAEYALIKALELSFKN